MAWGATLAAPAIASATDATSYSTASWTPNANRLVLVAIGYSVAAGTALPPTTLLGNGITYTNVVDAIGGGSGVSLYVGLSGAAPTAGAITASFGVVTQNGCEIHVIEVDGANISGTALGAIRQSVATLSGNVATPWDTFFTSLSVLGSSRCFTAFRNLSLNTAMTPRTGWTELGDAGHGSPNTSLESQWSNTIADQQMTVGGWAGNAFFRHVGVEVLAASSETPMSFATRGRVRPGPRVTRARMMQMTPVLETASPPPMAAGPNRTAALRRLRPAGGVPLSSTPAPTPPAFPLPTASHRVARGFARRGRTFAPPLPFRYPPRRVGAASTTGTATSLTPSITALLGLPDVTPYFVLACIKVFTGGVLSMSGSGWASSTNTWDAGGEQAIWIWKEPGVPAADPAFVWGGASIAYALSVVAYDGTHLTDAASSGFDAYSYPSIASGIEVGGTLVHVKAGDKDNQFGPCPNAAGFVQLVDAQAVGAGNVTINERDLYNSTSYAGPAIGNDKGIGFLFAIGSTANPPPSFIAQLRRRIFHAPRSRRATIQPVPDQQAAPANPAIVFGRAQPRIVRAALRRSRSAQPVPGQQTVAAGPARRAVRGWLRRGGKTTVVVPAPATPVNPAIVFYTPPRARGRGFLRRSKIAQPVPAPPAPPVNPALPGNSQPRRRVFGWFLRRRQPRTPIGLIVLSPLNAPTPTNVTGPDGRSSVSGSTGIASVSGPDGRSAVTGPNGSTIV